MAYAMHLMILFGWYRLECYVETFALFLRKCRNSITGTLIYYSPQDRVIRHFESSRSNEVAEGRLPTYAFARQYSNQLSYSDISYVSFSIDMKNQRND